MAQPFDDIRPSRIAKTALKDAMSSLDWNFTGDLQHNGSDVVTDADLIASIPNGSITNAKLANVASQTFKARTTAGVGAPEDVTATQATAMLDEMTGDHGGGGLPGLVPSQAAGDAAAGKFLKADGSWDVPAGGGGGGITELTGDVTAGPGAGAQAATIAVAAVSNAKLATVNQDTIKGRTAAGAGVVQDLTPAAVALILPAFSGIVGAAGRGVTPTTAGGDAAAGKFLKADGTWAIPPGAGGAPGGADTQVQFNDGGVFGGDPGLTYNAGTGTLSSNEIKVSNIAVSRALTTNGVGKITESATTATELGYVNGVTSAIQTQINNKQPLDATLTAVAAYNTNGLITQTAADTFTGRTITAGSAKITVANGSGVAGNPTIDASAVDILFDADTDDLSEGAINKYYDNALVQANTLNQMAAPTANLSMNTFRITNVVDPVGAQDACTKSYADAIASGLLLKQAVRLTTDADLPASTYNNGAAGVGATLTGDAVGILTIDGEDVVLNDRLLIKDQAAALENGIYECTTEGTAGVAFVLTRTTDNDTSAEILSSFCFTREGTVNGTYGFVNTNSAAINVGVDDINWTQFSSAGNITAGAGMVQAGNVFNIQTADANHIVVNADNIDTGPNVALSSNNLSFFSATTSAQLRSLLSDETGTGAAVFANNPVFNDPVLNSASAAAFTMDDGGSFRTLTGAGNDAFLQAYDTNLASYTTFATLTANNPPTFDISDSTTKGGFYIYRAGGTDVTVLDGGTGQSTFTSNGVLYGNAGAALQVTAASTADGQVLTSLTAGAAPTWRSGPPKVLVLSAAGGWGSISNGATGPGPAVVMAGNLQNFQCLNFAQGVISYAQWTGIAPENWDGLAIVPYFYWMCESAAVGSVVWKLEARTYKNGDSLDLAWNGGSTSDAALGTNVLAISDGGATFIPSGVVQPTGGDLLQFRVSRQTVGDTLAATALLMSVKITYTTT